MAAGAKEREQLKILPIPLDKESWENVPSLVFKTFTILVTNMTNIKKWADRADDRIRHVADQRERMEKGFEAADKACRAAQNGIDDLRGRLDAMSETARSHEDETLKAFTRLDSSMIVVFEQLCQAFGAEHSKDLGGGLHASKSLGSKTGRHESKAGTGVLQEGALKHGHSHSDLTKSGSMAAQMPTSPRSSGPRSLNLEEVGAGLERLLPVMAEAFSGWGHVREEDEKRRKVIDGEIEELWSLAQRTRDRLKLWKEVQKEIVAKIEILSDNLAATKLTVRELEETRIQRDDLKEALNAKGEEIGGLLKDVEVRLDGLGDRVKAHVSEVESMLEVAKSQTEQQISEHSDQVALRLQEHMNPVSAYMNNMKSKLDALRVDVDVHGDKVPKLAAALDDVSLRLEKNGEANSHRTAELEGLLDGLSKTVVELTSRSEGRDGELERSIQVLRSSMTERLDSLQEGLQTTGEALDNVKEMEIQSLAVHLQGLEYKVAKWVHAHPLPAKISEARLYALEACLAQETDARLTLEAKVKKKAVTLGSTWTPQKEQLTGGTTCPQTASTEPQTLPPLAVTDTPSLDMRDVSSRGTPQSPRKPRAPRY